MPPVVTVKLIFPYSRVDSIRAPLGSVTTARVVAGHCQRGSFRCQNFIVCPLTAQCNGHRAAVFRHGHRGVKLRRGLGSAAGCFSISTCSQCRQNEVSSGSSVPQHGQCFFRSSTLQHLHQRLHALIALLRRSHRAFPHDASHVPRCHSARWARPPPTRQAGSFRTRSASSAADKKSRKMIFRDFFLFCRFRQW